MSESLQDTGLELDPLFPSSPSATHTMATPIVARSSSQGTPGHNSPVLDAMVAQPAPQYAVYRPRSSQMRPPRPTRSVPPIPAEIETASSMPLPSQTRILTASPLQRSQSLIESTPEENLEAPLVEVPFPQQQQQQQQQKQEEDGVGKGKEPATKDAPPHVKAVAANPIEALHANNPEELTPLRAHYLKKSLIQLQFERELDAIMTSNPHWPNVSTLSYLGPPFLPPPKDAPAIDMPFLRYIFRQFVLTFPFMASTPKDFYSQKLQPFVTSAISRNLSASSVLDDDLAERKGEQVARKKIMRKVEKNLSMFLGAATRLAEQEEVVRLTQADLDRLEALSKRRQARMKKRRDWFEINVVGVRTVVDKGRVRSRVHDVGVLALPRRYAD